MGSAIDKSTRECDGGFGKVSRFGQVCGLLPPWCKQRTLQRCDHSLLARREAKKFVWAACWAALGRLAAAAVVGHAGQATHATEGEKEKREKKERTSQVVVARTA